MFVDASAAVAIIAKEADADQLAVKLEAAREAFISPVSQYESVLGVARALKATIFAATELVDDFIDARAIKNLAIDAGIAAAAISAFERYGKGRHKAGLNMGDCFAYACAKSLDLPLLCKGGDFRHTDVELA
ncbi:MAG: type II toxin-antitoxin system VapC family toxin [Rhizomicrobium sp.]